MTESVPNPLPALTGWDNDNSAFLTNAHDNDVEANRESFPFLYDDLDQPETLKNSAESLQRNAKAAVQRYYHLENELDLVVSLKLWNHWNQGYHVTGLDTAFLILAAYHPELVIRLYFLLKQIVLLGNIDENPPSLDISRFSKGYYPMYLLQQHALLSSPYRWEWNEVFVTWRGGSLSQLRDRVVSFDLALQKLRESWSVLQKLMDSLRKEVPLDGMEKVRTGVIATFAFFDGHVQECRDLIDTLEKEGEG